MTVGHHTTQAESCPCYSGNDYGCPTHGPLADLPRCEFCGGHGDIWTGWGGNRPVTCGHCHGTGKKETGDG